MNEEFLKSVMESLISMPFLEKTTLYIEAKDPQLGSLLESYKKAELLKDINIKFQEWKPNRLL
jgi:hypothetical protein